MRKEKERMFLDERRPDGTNRDARSGMEAGNEARRTFLRKGLIATSLLALGPRALTARTGECDPTTVDLYGQGPFYSAGAPARHVLAAPQEEGTRLFLTGTVYARDCISPLNDVVVDVWHADDKGCYSRFGDCENPSGDDYKLRGIIRTGAAGSFAVETIVPGRYLNGTQFRPSHIHFKVRPPGGSELITQLYFEGDPYIPVDLAASDPEAAGRIISLEEKEGGLHGVFDIILAVDPVSGVSDYKAAAGETRLRQNYPNPAAGVTRIPFHLDRRCYVRLTIHDIRGRLITTLLGGELERGAHSVEWDLTDESGMRFPGGSYVYRLRADGYDSSKVITVL